MHGPVLRLDGVSEISQPCCGCGCSKQADYFNPQQYNAIFDAELQKLLTRMPDGEARQQVSRIAGLRLGELHRPLAGKGRISG